MTSTPTSESTMPETESETVSGDAKSAVTILYTNWRGKTGIRRIAPVGSRQTYVTFWFGSNEWHPSPQWLLSAVDVDSGKERCFALSGLRAWGKDAVAAALAAAPAARADQHEAPQPDIVAYYARHIEWSRETFGAALRTKGIVQHISKELREIEASPHDLSEWIDVVILAMDGFWRHGGRPADFLPALEAKQVKNFARAWPDWRGAPEDSAIEHMREAVADCDYCDGCGEVTAFVRYASDRGDGTDTIGCPKCLSLEFIEERDRYKADRAADQSCIKADRVEIDSLLERLGAAQARIAELEAECESLRSALRPLVQAFMPWTEGRDEAGCLYNSEDSRCSVYPPYTLLGDLRRARALLSPPDPKPGGSDAS